MFKSSPLKHKEQAPEALPATRTPEEHDEKHGDDIVEPKIDVVEPEVEEDPGPLAEGFRAGDIYRIIEELIDEMASMGGGAVQGAMIGTGSKAGPWKGLNVEKENEKEKKRQKLKRKKKRRKTKGKKEKMVDEIMNYLLSTEALL